jgi:hypothetical protein
MIQRVTMPKSGLSMERGRITGWFVPDVRYVDGAGHLEAPGAVVAAITA